jgi:hypothetical protein
VSQPTKFEFGDSNARPNTQAANEAAFARARKVSVRRKPDKFDPHFDQLLCGTPLPGGYCSAELGTAPGKALRSVARSDSQEAIDLPIEALTVQPPPGRIFTGFPDTGYRLGSEERRRAGAGRDRSGDPAVTEALAAVVGRRARRTDPSTRSESVYPPCWIWCPRCHNTVNRVDDPD